MPLNQLAIWRFIQIAVVRKINVTNPTREKISKRSTSAKSRGERDWIVDICFNLPGDAAQVCSCGWMR